MHTDVHLIRMRFFSQERNTTGDYSLMQKMKSSPHCIQPAPSMEMYVLKIKTRRDQHIFLSKYVRIAFLIYEAFLCKAEKLPALGNSFYYEVAED